MQGCWMIQTTVYNPKATVNLPGLRSVLELRAEMGFFKQPLPRVEKYIDLSYYDRAVE
jgi:hypothetical protein